MSPDRPSHKRSPLAALVAGVALALACRDPLTGASGGTQTDGHTTSTASAGTDRTTMDPSATGQSTAADDASNSSSGTTNACPSDNPGGLLWRTNDSGIEGKIDGETAASDVAVDSNGDSFVVGHSSDSFWIASYDSDGHLNWSQTPEGHIEDRYYGVLIDPDGNVVVSGNTIVRYIDPSSVQIENLAVVHKYRPSGELLWALELPQDEPHAEYAGGMQVRSNGDLLLFTIADIESPYVIRLWQVSADGSTFSNIDLPDAQLEQWFPGSFVLAPDNSLIVVGRSQPERLGWTARVTLSGETLWNHTWPEVDEIHESISTIHQIAEDQYLLGGVVREGDEDHPWIVRIDSSGATLSEMLLGEPGASERAVVTVDGSGNLVLSGGTYVPGSSDALGMWVRQYDSDGMLLWHTDLEADAGQQPLALDPSCGIIVAGSEPSSAEMFIAKLSP